jgi:hypothetical protein
MTPIWTEYNNNEISHFYYGDLKNYNIRKKRVFIIIEEIIGKLNYDDPLVVRRATQALLVKDDEGRPLIYYISLAGQEINAEVFDFFELQNAIISLYDLSFDGSTKAGKLAVELQGGNFSKTKQGEFNLAIQNWQQAAAVASEALEVLNTELRKQENAKIREAIETGTGYEVPPLPTEVTSL